MALLDTDLAITSVDVVAGVVIAAVGVVVTVAVVVVAEVVLTVLVVVGVVGVDVVTTSGAFSGVVTGTTNERENDDIITHREC